MALVKLVKINENSFWAVWKAEEPSNALIEQAQLQEKDLVAWRAIHHPQKQTEWLISRTALVAVLEAMNIPLQRIHKDDKGKPFLQDSPYYISLANSFPYGVAVLHRHCAVGIDIEQPSEKLLRIQRKFLNEVEIRAVRGRLPHLCLYWCAKETLYKLYGRRQLSLKDNIVVHTVRLGCTIRAEASIVTETQAQTYQLEGTIIDGFFVVYSVV